MTIYDFSALTLAGDEVPLSDYEGRVVLVVNTASACGFTPQYAGLESLYRKFRSRGFTVLGFPCNQFGHQEPGSEAEIGQFCEKNYGVTFPMFAKIEVNGANAHPLFKFLRHEKGGFLGTKNIKWNFTKFLIGRNGEVVSRHAPQTKPEELEKPIEALL